MGIWKWLRGSCKCNYSLQKFHSLVNLRARTQGQKNFPKTEVFVLVNLVAIFFYIYSDLPVNLWMYILICKKIVVKCGRVLKVYWRNSMDSTIASPSTPKWNVDRPFLTGRFHQVFPVIPFQFAFSPPSCLGLWKELFFV